MGNEYQDNKYGWNFNLQTGMPGWCRTYKHCFESQFHQDWFLYSAIFQHYDDNYQPIHVDLAANDYRFISNTFFFDKCMSWNGICIEAQSRLWPNLRNKRSCTLIANCIWSEPKELIMQSIETDEWFNGLAGIKEFNKAAQNPRVQRLNVTENKMMCQTLQSVFDAHDVTHVDYISLDVEGAELHALKGIDFDRMQIDVFTTERSGQDGNVAIEYLKNNGYIHKFNLGEDVVLIHQNANKAMSFIDDWIKNSEWQNKSDFTKHRFDAHI